MQQGRRRRRRPRQPAQGTLGQGAATVAAVAARETLDPNVGEVKAQGVRLADIFVFGPLMLYAGLGRDPPQWVKIGMLLMGAGTIIYNAVNWFEISRRSGDLAGMATGPVDRARAEALKRRIEMASKP